MPTRARAAACSHAGRARDTRSAARDPRRPNADSVANVAQLCATKRRPRAPPGGCSGGVRHVERRPAALDLRRAAPQVRRRSRHAFRQGRILGERAQHDQVRRARSREAGRRRPADRSAPRRRRTRVPGCDAASAAIRSRGSASPVGLFGVHRKASVDRRCRQRRDDAPEVDRPRRIALDCHHRGAAQPRFELVAREGRQVDQHAAAFGRQRVQQQLDHVVEPGAETERSSATSCRLASTRRSAARRRSGILVAPCSAAMRRLHGRARRAEGIDVQGEVEDAGGIEPKRAATISAEAPTRRAGSACPLRNAD